MVKYNPHSGLIKLSGMFRKRHGAAVDAEASDGELPADQHSLCTIDYFQPIPVSVVKVV